MKIELRGNRTLLVVGLLFLMLLVSIPNSVTSPFINPEDVINDSRLDENEIIRRQYRSQKPDSQMQTIQFQEFWTQSPLNNLVMQPPEIILCGRIRIL